ncbi:hypothetical protein J437_LFUL004471 [Ladona fulva]|uniref:Uncharacterized protein n=1 Tax=Ladona fulva TaxID=123851 RepID=A0A8K0NUV4_LADFU|nr:hypothetical protein J437_LFUL004471 [Ladona fulva]
MDTDPPENRGGTHQPMRELRSRACEWVETNSSEIRTLEEIPLPQVFTLCRQYNLQSSVTREETFQDTPNLKLFNGKIFQDRGAASITATAESSKPTL